MKFDDIFKPYDTKGQTITSYYDLDDASMTRKVMDMVKMMKTSDVLDTFVIDTGLALADSKEEAGVLFYLLSKAMLSEVFETSEETSKLLEMTLEALLLMSEEAQAEYAQHMIGMMLDEGMIGLDEDDDE